MAYLKKLHIKKLGQIQDARLDDFSPAFNIIYGSNGTGKTTARNAIRFALFGLPRKGSTEKHTDPSYWAKNSAAREIRATIESNSGLHTIARTSPDGKVDGGAEYSSSAAEREFESYIGGVSEQDYKTIWNISEFDLENILPGKGSTVISRLISTSYGLTNSPTDELEKLRGDIMRLGLDKKTDELYKKAEQLTRVNDELANLRKKSREIYDNSRAIEKLDASDKDLVKRIAAEQERYTHATRILTQLETAEADLKKYSVATSEVVKKLKNLEAERNGIEQECPKNILGLSDAIQDAAKDASLIEDQMTNRVQTEETLSQIEDDLAKYKDIPDFPTIIDADYLSSEATRRAEIVLDAQETANRAQVHLASTESELAACKKRLEETDPRTNTRKTMSLKIAMGVTIMPSVLAALALVFLARQTIGGLIAVILGLVAFVLIEITSANRLPEENDGEGREITSKISQLHMNLITDKTDALSAGEASGMVMRAWTDFLNDNFPDLTQDASPSEVPRLIAKITAKAKLFQKRDETRLQLNRYTRAIDAWEQKVIALCTQVYGLGREDTMPTKDIERLSENLSEAKQSQRDLSEITIKIESASAALKVATEGETIASATRKRAAQFLESNFVPLVDEDEPLPQLKELKVVAEAEIRNLEARHSEHSSECGRLKGLVEAAAEDEALLEKESEKAAITAKIAIIAKEYLTKSIAYSLLDSATTEYEQNRVPVVIEKASEAFSRLTDNLYVRVSIDSKASEPVKVLKNDGVELVAERLSLGTLNQLYLALRLGILRAQPDYGRNLPIVFDDVLATFDPKRKILALVELTLLAQNHQVLYFTKDERETDQKFTSKWKEFNLEVIE
ncbi:MAG: AAA family ATPase [Coriobacteriia bacterium]|nr:AAA family ATPase [Coriobacteriia bacterium]